MTPVLVLWFALGVATLGLAIYRKIISRGEDTAIHLEATGGAMAEGQTTLEHKLTAIDKWGKTLTVVTFVLGVAIGAVYVYQALLAVPV